MSACLWYISKYVGFPADRVGERAFMLLREIARKGHHCIIVTSNSSHMLERPGFEGFHKTEQMDGVEVCRIQTLKYRGAKSLGRILSWLHFEWLLWRLPKQAFRKPDAVIVSSLSLLTIFNGFLLRRRYGCRLIFEVRDIWPLTLIEEGGFSPRNPFVAALGIVERLAYRCSDAIVGTMPNLKEHVAEQIGSSPPVHCVPMGIDTARIYAAETLPLDYVAVHIPKDKFVVCHAGTIGATNALDTLFDCARIMRDDPRIYFLIVGDGDLKDHYRTLCADLPNVGFAPAVPKAMVQDVLKRCDLLYFSVHASAVWRFGQSLNKVIDYMLAGRPILASYTGYPSMIDESGGGSYVPAGNVEALRMEILRYAEMSPTERAALGAAGRDWLLDNRAYNRLSQDYLEIALPTQVAV
ncbi:glycosyltransferase family 4 protein [Sphingopyxis sp. EG6]|uniref:glycosyltransferase family 4 protein n=1 Tax=Sphingopyxis sp. EG6 TaxID=1874061 RepID=UPI000DC61765|nr:glycosyltransferase family 4 protein [Sphingopyxis sp. EG6]BBB08629.1 probable glycosyltransferase [Sphingopyxis sp. EG6]